MKPDRVDGQYQSLGQLQVRSLGDSIERRPEKLGCGIDFIHIIYHMLADRLGGQAFGERHDSMSQCAGPDVVQCLGQADSNKVGEI